MHKYIKIKQYVKSVMLDDSYLNTTHIAILENAKVDHGNQNTFFILLLVTKLLYLHHKYTDQRIFYFN